MFGLDPVTLDCRFSSPCQAKDWRRGARCLPVVRALLGAAAATVEFSWALRLRHQNNLYGAFKLRRRLSIVEQWKCGVTWSVQIVVIAMVMMVGISVCVVSVVVVESRIAPKSRSRVEPSKYGENSAPNMCFVTSGKRANRRHAETAARVSFVYLRAIYGTLRTRSLLR